MPSASPQMVPTNAPLAAVQPADKCANSWYRGMNIHGEKNICEKRRNSKEKSEIILGGELNRRRRKEKNTIGGYPKIWAPIVREVDEGR